MSTNPDLPNDADMKISVEIDHLGDYTRAKRIRQYVNAETAKLRDQLKQLDAQSVCKICLKREAKF